LRVFKNRVLRIMFGPRRDEVTREWRKLHNEELNDLYSSPNTVRVIKSRRMRWAGHVERVGREEAYIEFWWGNMRERDPLERHRRKWEDNIEMDLREVGGGGMDWIDLALDRDRWRALVNAVMKSSGFHKMRGIS
jgi:hypothetical protein